MLSQWIFAAYVMTFYWGTAVRGETAKWNEVLAVGIVPGDTMGNTALAIHVGLAGFMIIAGPLQLMPQVRSRWPMFHRWVGRSYVVLAIIVSSAGLFLEITRDNIGGIILEISTGTNGAVAIICAIQAWRYALAKRFTTHRDWAIRLWLMASGVWFFRILLMFWVLINQGPVGIGENFDGWAVIMLAYSSWLMPLAVFELYRSARDNGGVQHRTATATLLGVLTLATLAGSAMAAYGMWWPRIG